MKLRNHCFSHLFSDYTEVLQYASCLVWRTDKPLKKPQEVEESCSSHENYQTWMCEHIFWVAASFQNLSPHTCLWIKFWILQGPEFTIYYNMLQSYATYVPTSSLSAGHVSQSVFALDLSTESSKGGRYNLHLLLSWKQNCWEHVKRTQFSSSWFHVLWINLNIMSQEIFWHAGENKQVLETKSYSLVFCVVFFCLFYAPNWRKSPPRSRCEAAKLCTSLRHSEWHDARLPWVEWGPGWWHFFQFRRVHEGWSHAGLVKKQL